jgi:hypothetical protein
MNPELRPAVRKPRSSSAASELRHRRSDLEHHAHQSREAAGAGHLPILGTLYRSSTFRRAESELVTSSPPISGARGASVELAQPNTLSSGQPVGLILDGRLTATHTRTWRNGTV